MSNYYNIKGLKVRVSDHEPNTRLNGSADIYIWTSDACGNKMSIGAQIDSLIDKKGFELSDFAEIINDFADIDEECGYMLIELNNQ